MFREFNCGCIVSEQQDRVRICATHRPQSADGRGAYAFSLLRGGTKCYPANGESVPGWNGR